jgi:fused signal recognition particle receptor
LDTQNLAVDGIALAIAIAVFLLLVLWFLRLRRKGKIPSDKAPPELPLETPRIDVELPPSEAEAQLKQEASAARQEAQVLASRRREVTARLEQASDPAERERLREVERSLREDEERLKRDGYRAKKAADREERERHDREREEADRLRAEQDRLRAEEQEALRRDAAEAARQKVAAEAGRTLAAGLDKTRSLGFVARINAFLGGEKEVDETLLAELEEILFTADIGVKTAARLVEVARDRLRKKELSSPDKVKAVIREEVERILDLPVPKSLEGGGPPHVTMVVGVNGAGKTTTLGKLAAQATGQGRKVILAAGDTFRAAAAEQLDVWAERAHAQLVKGAEGSDPGAVVFEAIKVARDQGAALVLADTAGRLHTKVPLMEELKKVRRVMDKALAGAPHEVLLVLDATVGQNAIAQAKQFHEAVGVTAIALTKLDGTAKGGVVIGLCDELKLPVVWVGVGEKVSDLRRFDPKEFAAALFD